MLLTKTDAKLIKIEVCNEVLKSFANETYLELSGTGHVLVCWSTYRDVSYRKRWQTRGQDFYPVWHRRWAHGGTACTALAQLVRWVQGKPVLPISSWEYWAGERCKLLRSGPGPGKVIEILRLNGYPEQAHCVLCGIHLDRSFDWWSLNGVSGPCCDWTHGCRQKKVPTC